MAGVLPNLLVAGVPKAGTGSLFAHLSDHPEVCGADEKEIGYLNHFDPRRHVGPPPPLEQYRRHFAHWSGERYTVEATPTYSYVGRPVIEAARRLLGDVRVVISLRDPVDRLWSAYTFQRASGHLAQLRSFEEYLAALEERWRAGVVPKHHDRMHGLYIGFYDQYVPLWLDEFGDRLKIVFAEHLARDPAVVVAELFRWLDLDDSVAGEIDLERRNRTHHPRSTQAAVLAYGANRVVERLHLPSSAVRALRRTYARVNAGRPPAGMSDEVRRHVEQLYRPSNERVAAALAVHGYRDLPEWLRVSVSG